MKYFAIYAHLCSRMTVRVVNEEAADARMLSDDILRRLATLCDNGCSVWHGRLADLTVRRAYSEAEKWDRGFSQARNTGAMPGDDFAVVLDEVPDVIHPYTFDALYFTIEAD